MFKLLQVSVAVATPVTLVRVSAGQLSVTPAGQVMLGGLVSSTEMEWTWLALFVGGATPVMLGRVSAGQLSVTPAGQVMLGGLVSTNEPEFNWQELVV